ncbi:MAG TPA: histidine kinase, partial [Bryobacteraceae bacterium]|nr:histidine kinase [Bryobacteraceae bacterium]
NAGSLIALATPAQGNPLADVMVAVSFSALSVLPAVLLHVSVATGEVLLRRTGYAVSGVAVALHVSDAVTGAPRFHYAGILLVTIGFSLLAATEVAREALAGRRDGSGARLAGGMVLFLFAISFAHFRSTHDVWGWSGEAALHHCGIPLAVFVLLQDYRFLLLDAFMRFVLNAGFAAAGVAASYEAIVRFHLLDRAAQDPFEGGLIFGAACVLVSLFVWARSGSQRWLTRVVFLRANVEEAVGAIRGLAIRHPNDDSEYLADAAAAIAAFFSAERFAVEERHSDAPGGTVAVVDDGSRDAAGWARAMVQLRFLRGDSVILLLGPRAGGRRYLSEDLEILDRLGATACEQVERLRSLEMQNLVSQAELKALQAQINPHFFFNSLNTLYGTIARENKKARRLVTNLADLFRYSFGVDRTFIRLDEEMRMVRAYLEIEKLRLGEKLCTEFEIDNNALSAEVPILSIQPLIENAVKHGVAARRGAGFVRLTVRDSEAGTVVTVTNSGAFEPQRESGTSTGIGLGNVRRRLLLCYGAETRLEIASENDLTRVWFVIPPSRSPAVGARLQAR